MESNPGAAHIIDQVWIANRIMFMWSLRVILNVSMGSVKRYRRIANSIAESASNNTQRLVNIFATSSIILFAIRIYLFQVMRLVIISIFSASFSILDIYVKVLLVAKLKYTPSNFESEELLYVRNCIIFIILLNQINSLLRNHLVFWTNRTQFMYRAGMLGILYRKMLTMSLASYKTYNTGKLSTILQVDLNNVVVVFELIPLMTTSFIILTVVGWFMWGSIRTGVLFLAACILLLLGVESTLALIKNRYNHSYLRAKDLRVQLMKSTIHNIRVIKIKALELYYCHKLKKSRAYEISMLVPYLLASLVNTVIKLTGAQYAKIAAVYFSIYFIEGVNKTALRGFDVYYPIFNKAIVNLIEIIKISTDIFASASRISKFLKCEEKTNYTKSTLETDAAVEIKDGLFWWDELELIQREELKRQTQSLRASLIYDTVTESKQFILEIGDLKIKKGELVVVIGDNGGGKSSLLYAIIGETAMSSHTKIGVSGKVSFTPQVPWIVPGTLKENILFGSDYDDDWLTESLKAADFYRDVLDMEKGLGTFCEEHGVNLSGGQRARLSLARCFYQQADLILLDDPLKSLDAKVALRVMENGFCGILKDKTRIITTNNPQHIKYADRVIIMGNGEILYDGGFEGAACHEYLDQRNIKIEIKKNDLIVEKIAEEKRTLDLNIEEKEIEEKMQYGRVSRMLVIQTIRESLGFLGFGFIIALFCLCIYFYRSIRSVLDVISNDESNETTSTPLIISFGYTCGMFTSMLLIGITLIFFGVRFSSALHFKMVFGLLHSKVDEYLDLTHSGIILNRFTNDLDVADRSLIRNIFSILYPLLLITTTIYRIFKVTTNYIVILEAVGFIILTLILQHYYMKANNNLGRMELLTRSSILKEGISISSGITEIRAMRKERYIRNGYLRSINANLKWFSLKQGVESGFKLYVEMLNNYLLVLPSFVQLYFRLDNSEGIGVSRRDFTFLLQKSDTIGRDILQVLHLYNEIELDFLSIERCKEIEDLEPEKGYRNLDRDRKQFLHSDDADVLNYYRQEQMPDIHNGLIQLQNITASYKTRRNHTVEDISIDIKPGEKIAVVGRTGAGKSSIAKLIWGALTPQNGRILLGGIDMKDLDLKKMRAEISVVSQDIMVIDGTLRENIDPILQLEYELLGDENYELFSIVKERLIDLGFPKEKLDEHGFDLVLGAESIGLNIGHFQMVCLVRETLKKKKIVVLDEVTSNLDVMAEENFRQMMCGGELRDSTVVSITHRLQTVNVCDRVMVMNMGKLVELGNPRILFSDPESELYSLGQHNM